MHKRLAFSLITLIAIIAVVGPIFAALSIARSRGLEAQQAEALKLATNVQVRADSVAKQFFDMHDALVKAHADNPCSENSIDLMRQLAFSSSYLRAVGFVAGNSLVCSSLGIQGNGLSIGEPDMITPKGVSIRKAVRLPIATGFDVRISEKDGFAAIMARDVALDIDTHTDGMLKGVFYLGATELVTSNGNINPAWLERLGSAQSASFLDGDYVVAMRRSAQYNLVAVVATPVVYLTQNVRKLALVMVPLGAVTALLLITVLAWIARHQTTMQTMIRTALKRHEFHLVYQPVVDLHTGRWVGAEALIRWRRINGEMIPPDIFIPEAERAGLITQITERVVELVTYDINHHFKAFKDFHVAINLSAADFGSDQIVGLLYRLLRTTGLKPGQLIIEATERGLINAEEARRIIRDIRSLDIGVAIDDFGTGYSSLSYLTTLQLDYLKIDKSFTDTIGKDAAASHVPAHIIAMARSLRLQCIAEGVETTEQAEFLRMHGVQYAQGWLFSRAIPPAEMAQKLRSMKSVIRKMEDLV
ncbi:sensor c-di-GMP phosphodiesterase-like protein [Silvimonas terrae]|uniref:cyclic-guanylate-specific phosphodiesterase n=1 Tax=Silvimonas terrae TaxID=300266 RepID=A0A840RIF8_9NEIS|nr:EAL domain-containing protein [Silvimonas terrae]MBB5192887.1 sensor c-di-GMP phosphodiesterase-like protein [Silvimonas terrae]